ncbi:MAG TPA: response regulator [Thermodesulfobacteriota bacterium]|nr:response regulator [Thermodesulfobacteriota bacterium]
MKTKKILIVDDKETMRVLLSEVLRPLGQEIETAGSKNGAIQRLAEKIFDLVIIDNLICVTNGFELLQSMKKMYPSLPILVVNTNGFDAEILQKGALACIPRPVNPSQLHLLSHLILNIPSLSPKSK